MIKNELQYNVTKAKARNFEQALAAFDGAKANVHPMLAKAQRDALESQLAELNGQLKDYEKLRAGRYKKLRKSPIQSLPIDLIRARIARGLTQKDLAMKLGVKVQQIQRYEETEYASASFARINQVIQALEIEVKEEVFFA